MRIENIYQGIITRCYNDKHPSYKYYGGRGIGVCEDWQNDKNNFYDWAILNGYNDSLQIDRIDNYKGYYPDNCRFVTPKENTRNKRKSIIVFFKGKPYKLCELCEMYNISYAAIYKHIRTNSKQDLDEKIYRMGMISLRKKLNTFFKINFYEVGYRL